MKPRKWIGDDDDSRWLLCWGHSAGNGRSQRTAGVSVIDSRIREDFNWLYVHSVPGYRSPVGFYDMIRLTGSRQC